MLSSDVLVVGAGAAGLATALSAARNGADVLVVERRPGTSTVPRATGISTRTMEILRTWGLTRAVRAGRIACTPRSAVAPTLAEADEDATPQGIPTARAALAVSPGYPAFCPQDHLEPILAAEIRRLGGQVRFASRVTALAVTGDGVRARLGPGEVVRARFVVGADGPESTVRRALGIGWERLGGLGGWIQVLFRADLAARLGRRPPGLTFVTHPAASGVLAPVGAGRWAFVRQVDPDPDAHRPAPDVIGPDEWMALLRAASGYPDLEVELVATLPFTMAADVASTVRAGPGFVVGDAAHRMTPLTGAGLNTAVQDGHELGWRLAWTARGLAGEALLDSYCSEREPIGRARAEQSLLPPSHPDPVARLAEDLAGTYRSAVVADDGGPPATGLQRSARPGERAPHVWVRYAGRRRSTLDLFDGRLTLLTGRAGQSWARAGAGLLPVPLQVLAAGRDLIDVHGMLERAYRLRPGSAVLVRPDGVVAWRGDHPGELAGAIAMTLGRRPGQTSVAATEARPA